MTTIRLLDARRGLNLKCRELFRDEKIADEIYRYLCDGIEECEDAEPKRRTGKWIEYIPEHGKCPFCGNQVDLLGGKANNFCGECGADMSRICEVNRND